MSSVGARGGAALRTVWRLLVRMPAAARLGVVALVIVLGFVAVVVPLFAGGGTAQAELAGSLPGSVVAGAQVRVDIALDNVGDSFIDPVCVAMSGPGARLLSADFQGLDHVTARANRVCGGRLTGQETISVTLVFTLSERGGTRVTLVPEEGSRTIGPVLGGTVVVF